MRISLLALDSHAPLPAELPQQLVAQGHSVFCYSVGATNFQAAPGLKIVSSDKPDTALLQACLTAFGPELLHVWPGQEAVNGLHGRIPLVVSGDAKTGSEWLSRLDGWTGTPRPDFFPGQSLAADAGALELNPFYDRVREQYRFWRWLRQRGEGGCWSLKQEHWLEPGQDSPFLLDAGSSSHQQLSEPAARASVIAVADQELRDEWAQARPELADKLKVLYPSPLACPKGAADSKLELEKGLRLLARIDWRAGDRWQPMLQAYLTHFGTADDLCLAMLSRGGYSDSDGEILMDWIEAQGHDPEAIAELVLLEEPDRLEPLCHICAGVDLALMPAWDWRLIQAGSRFGLRWLAPPGDWPLALLEPAEAADALEAKLLQAFAGWGLWRLKPDWESIWIAEIQDSIGALGGSR